MLVTAMQLYENRNNPDFIPEEMEPVRYKNGLRQVILSRGDNIWLLEGRLVRVIVRQINLKGDSRERLENLEGHEAIVFQSKDSVENLDSMENLLLVRVRATPGWYLPVSVLDLVSCRKLERLGLIKSEVGMVLNKLYGKHYQDDATVYFRSK